MKRLKGSAFDRLHGIGMTRNTLSALYLRTQSGTDEPLKLFCLGDLVDIDDADGSSSVTPLRFISEPFCKYISRHIGRRGIFTVVVSVGHLSRYNFV